MKQIYLILVTLLLFSCGNNKMPSGYIGRSYDTKYCSDTLKVGENDIFIRVLGNGDSLFMSYFVDSKGHRNDIVYYTTGNTKSVQWSVQEGKSTKDVSNIKQLTN